MNEQFRQHGAFSWCELMTTDVEAAKAFYTKLFGWGAEDMPMPGMNYTGQGRRQRDWRNYADSGRGQGNAAGVGCLCHC